jgi:uncharacterized protein DUF5648
MVTAAAKVRGAPKTTIPPFLLPAHPSRVPVRLSFTERATPMTYPIRAVFMLAALLLPTAGAAFLINFPPDRPPATEYVNDISGHYLLLNDPAEVAAVATGAAGPGWRTTGYVFEVRPPGDAVADGNVCRFYAPGPNSHFFTAHADECNHLRNNATGWLFEKFAFSAMLAHGNCEFMQNPVYRLYNNRWMFNDSNHRYTPDPEVRARMIAQGWVDEGIAFCTPFWQRVAEKGFLITSAKLAPTAECENESINLGSCTALNQMPEMPNSVTSFLPPFWVVANPAYPTEADAATGVRGSHQLQSAYPASDRQAVALHSFLQTNGNAPAFGIWVNSFDRTVGELSSINPLYQFSTRPPLPGTTDLRIFPWGDGRDHDLEVSFRLRVATLLRADPQSHAYGHPTLQFVDRRSGQHLYVTLGAYGSVTPEDFVARDTGTGRVIVATIFRSNPAFGQRISGEWIACPGQGACAPAATDTFRFRIDRVDFQHILDRARTVNGALSADVSDYLMANFHFNNEVYRDGAIGLSLSDYRLDIFTR